MCWFLVVREWRGGLLSLLLVLMLVLVLVGIMKHERVFFGCFLDVLFILFS